MSSLGETVVQIEPKLEIEIRINDQTSVLNLLSQSVIKERISCGDHIFIAFLGGEPIAYLFATSQDCWVDEVKDWLILGSGEVYIYDALTLYEYRGNLLYPSLIVYAAKFYKELSYSHALIFTSALNRRSTIGIERANFYCYQVINFYNLFGFQIWDYKLRSRDVQSRFRNEI